MHRGEHVPQSKSRSEADAKKKAAARAARADQRAEKKRLAKGGLGTRRGWVVPTFVTLMLLGVLWLVVWYLTASTGITVPGMTGLGNWNLLIGMVLMGASFGVATLWK